jgi:hypothetical protein
VDRDKLGSKLHAVVSAADVNDSTMVERPDRPKGASSPATTPAGSEWVSRFRRLARRYDRKASHFAGFVSLARTLICCRGAVRLNLLTSNNTL